MVKLFFYTSFLQITNSKRLQIAWAVPASQQYLFIHLCLLILINITVGESFMAAVGQDPNPPSPTQGFIAGHANTFCGKPFGHPPKSYNLLCCGGRRQGRWRERAKNLNNTSPATTQNLNNLWASTKRNYLHPSQTQHKQGRLAGQPQMCF